MVVGRETKNGFGRWIERSLGSLHETGHGAHFPALDGLRAIAITLVIAGMAKNDFVHAGGEARGWFFDGFLAYGWTGVDLFFVLSGFLIGRMLFVELRDTRSIQVVPFLLRRGFRIWPLYYFVCAVGLLILMRHGSVQGVSAILPDLFFFTNYTKETLVYGSWSLSVEEQFYLLGAIGVYFGRNLIARSGSHALSFLIALLVIAPVVRHLSWRYLVEIRAMDPFTAEWHGIHGFLHTHYDGLAMGMVFAALYVFWPREKENPARTETCLILGTVVTAAAAYALPMAFQYSLAAAFFGWAVWHGLTRPKSYLTRALSWPGFRPIARLSFGMYLWYRFPLWKIAELTVQRGQDLPTAIQYAIVFLTVFAVAAVAAAVTYVFVERPFLELRSRIYGRTHANRLDYPEMAVSRN